jgi:hypothetical protein
MHTLDPWEQRTAPVIVQCVIGVLRGTPANHRRVIMTRLFAASLAILATIVAVVVSTPATAQTHAQTHALVA